MKKEYIKNFLFTSHNTNSTAYLMILASTLLRLYYALTRDLFPSGPDGPYYMQVMTDLASKGFLSKEISYLPFYPSGYPTVMSLFPKLFSIHWEKAAQSFQILLLGIALIVLYKFLHSIFNQTVALISIVFISLSPSWLVFPGEAMYESVLISLLIFYFSYFYFQTLEYEMNIRTYIILGLLAGFTLSVHPRTLPLLILPFIFFRREEFQKKKFFLFGFMSLLFPLLFALRNLIGEGKFTLFSASISSYNFGHQKMLHGTSTFEIIWKALSHPLLFLHDTGINSLYFFSPFSGPSAMGLWYHNISAYALLERNGYRSVSVILSISFSILAFILLLASLRYLWKTFNRISIFFTAGILILYLTDALIYGENRHRLVAFIFTIPVYANYVYGKIVLSRSSET